uniref:Uncharacterized protein n=1 Tax=Hemiselmis andersenii TaxID=464988 RepID=A0A7S0TVT3_HEMAN
MCLVKTPGGSEGDTLRCALPPFFDQAYPERRMEALAATLGDALPVVLDLSSAPDTSPDGAVEAARTRPGANVVRLDGCKSITVDAVSQLGHALPALSDLSLAGCTQLDSEALCAKLSTEFPNLKTLDVRQCSQLSDRDLALIMVRRSIKGLGPFRYST